MLAAFAIFFGSSITVRLACLGLAFSAFMAAFGLRLDFYLSASSRAAYSVLLF